jgi:Zn-dependent protease with chaperone function
MNRMTRHRDNTKSWKRGVRGLSLLTAAACCAAPVAADVPRANADGQMFAAIRAADMRLATIGYRLAATNAALCDRLEPATGIQLQTLDLYAPGQRAAARAFFRFETLVGIEGIVADSPAALAGLREDDSIVAIGPVRIAETTPDPDASTRRLIALHAAIAALPPEAPIAVEALRGGTRVAATVHPLPACRTRFELRIASDFEALADGEMVQISARFLDDYADIEVAAVVAHELAHNILRHRERLDAQGVDFGMLSGFGANVKYFRQTELEADLLSVTLMANAGYDPLAVAAFWRKFGRSGGSAVFRSRSHPAWRERAATVEHEARIVMAASARPLIPAILAARERPLDGDWQKLLVRN